MAEYNFFSLTVTLHIRPILKELQRKFGFAPIDFSAEAGPPLPIANTGIDTTTRMMLPYCKMFTLLLPFMKMRSYTMAAINNNDN